MKIVSKRNALVGFVVLKVGKIVARKKAKKLKQKLPSRPKR
jgi:pyrimidine deaminase RibD-like protein